MTSLVEALGGALLAIAPFDLATFAAAVEAAPLPAGWLFHWDPFLKVCMWSNHVHRVRVLATPDWERADGWICVDGEHEDGRSIGGMEGEIAWPTGPGRTVASYIEAVTPWLRKIEDYHPAGKLVAAGLPVRSCGLNADWSVQAWHLGPSERPNWNDGDLYLLGDEGDTFDGYRYNLARMNPTGREDPTSDGTGITMLADVVTLDEAIALALRVLAGSAL